LLFFKNKVKFMVQFFFFKREECSSQQDDATIPNGTVGVFHKITGLIYVLTYYSAIIVSSSIRFWYG
jgi:hypothetical protein